MKTTNVLAGSMRRLLANLHPPSPPTARESQQLLGLLQKSFKARLDEQHPAPSQHDFWPKYHDQEGIPISTSSTSSHATNTHLSSILTHSMLGSPNGMNTRQNAVLEFDRLVAEPEIDLLRLAKLVRWYSREVKAGKQSQEHGEKLSDRLNSWLHVTNRLSRETFLLDFTTRTAALELFNSEHNEAILWTWLRLVYERRLIHADVTSTEWLAVEDGLVSGLMRMSIQKKNNTDAAQQFLEACRYRLDSGRCNLLKDVDQTEPTKSMNPPMAVSGERLASAIIFHRQLHGIDATLFKNILEYLPIPSENPSLNVAFCSVYNPSGATAKRLYSYLKDGSGAQKLILSKAMNKPHSRKVILISLLDASKLALEDGYRAQASFLLNFAVDNFPEHLPARKTEKLEPEIERYLHLVPG